MAGTISHIHARNAALYVAKAAVTFGVAISLDQATIGTIFKVKNLVITPPMSEVEKIDFWGSDSLDTYGAGVPAAGTWQHQTLSEKSWTEAKAAFTLVFSHDEVGITTPPTSAVQEAIESLFHGQAIDVTDDPAFSRYKYGDINTSGEQRLRVGNFVFVFNNGAGIVNIGMSAVIVTKMGDVKPTATDGHWEMDCEAVCLAQDFVHEKED